MTTIALITSVLSLVIFSGFTGYSVYRFGWRHSYSAYAAKWHEAVPLASNTHLWSIVSVAWICFVAERWWTIPVWLLAAFLVAVATSTVKKSWLFWLEMAMFGAAYTTIFFG